MPRLIYRVDVRGHPLQTINDIVMFSFCPCSSVARQCAELLLPTRRQSLATCECNHNPPLLSKSSEQNGELFLLPTQMPLVLTTAVVTVAASPRFNSTDSSSSSHTGSSSSSSGTSAASDPHDTHSPVSATALAFARLPVYYDVSRRASIIELSSFDLPAPVPEMEAAPAVYVEVDGHSRPYLAPLVLGDSFSFSKFDYLLADSGTERDKTQNNDEHV
jgi:hypothetical protein